MGFRVYDASPRYIYQTKFGYCFRFVFPSDLRRIISKKELRFSLKTRDQSTAKALSRRLAGFIQDFCSNLRDLATTRGEFAVCRDQAEINELMKTYFHSVIDGDFQSSLKSEIMASRLFNSDQPCFQMHTIACSAVFRLNVTITARSLPQYSPWVR